MSEEIKSELIENKPKKKSKKNIIIIMSVIVLIIVISVIFLILFSNKKVDKKEILDNYQNCLFNNELAIAKKDDKWGYINKDGEFVIEAQFDETYNFSVDGIARVKIDKKYGYINKSGEIINMEFDYAEDFTEYGLAAVKFNNHYGIIDKNGEYVIEPEYDCITEYGEAILDSEICYFYNYSEDRKNLLREDLDKGNFVVLKDGLYGLIDKNGDVIIEPQFDLVRGFSNNGLAAVCEDGKWGYINKDGDFIIEPQYDRAYNFAKNGLALIWKYDRHKYNSGIAEPDYFYINEKGEEIIEFDNHYGKNSHYYISYLPCSFEKNGLAYVTTSRQGVIKSGFIDKTGKFIIKNKFVYDMDAIKHFSKNGLCFVREEDGDYGYINEKGKYVIKLDKYDEYNNFKAHSFEDNGLALIEKEDEYLIIDEDGETIFESDAILSLYFDYIIFAEDKKLGVMDLDGNVIIEPKLDGIGNIDISDYCANKDCYNKTLHSQTVYCSKHY